MNVKVKLPLKVDGYLYLSGENTPRSLLDKSLGICIWPAQNETHCLLLTTLPSISAKYPSNIIFQPGGVSFHPPNFCILDRSWGRAQDPERAPTLGPHVFLILCLWVSPIKSPFPIFFTFKWSGVLLLLIPMKDKKIKLLYLGKAFKKMLTWIKNNSNIPYVFFFSGVTISIDSIPREGTDFTPTPIPTPISVYTVLCWHTWLPKKQGSSNHLKSVTPQYQAKWIM